LAAEKFVDEQLAIAVLNKFGYDEAAKVLAPAICQRIALRSSVNATDVPALSSLFSELPEVDSDHATTDDEDDASRLSAYENASVATAETEFSEVSGLTTASTRKRLSDTMKENETLCIANEEMREQHKEMELELSHLRLALQASKATIPPEVTTLDGFLNDDVDDELDDLDHENFNPTNDDDILNTLNTKQNEQTIYTDQTKKIETTIDDNTSVSSLCEDVSRKAQPAMVDTVVPISPERSGQLEPSARGEVETPLENEMVSSRYPRRENVKARGATTGAASRD